MNKRFHLTEFYDLSIAFYGNAILASLLLWAFLVYVGAAMLELSPLMAGFAALFATLLHWDAAMWHQFGHAWAARRTGHPMKGVTAWWLLSTSVYPSDEPELPAGVHIRRALGGPLASLVYSLLAGLLALLFYSSGPAARMVVIFWFLDSFIVFGIGSLLPLGFTDGSTLLSWWPRRNGGD